MSSGKQFAFKEGADIFSPKDLVQLGRPSSGVPNPAGDLVLVRFSQYSLEDRKNKKSAFIFPLELPTTTPLQIPLEKGGDTFWLDDRTFAVVYEGPNKVLELHAVQVELKTDPLSLISQTPILIGAFPTNSASDFQYNRKAETLVFSDEVYEDEDIHTVTKQDEEWENRGNTAFVYDSESHDYDRHWDHWVLPKKSTLFSVRLGQNPDGVWALGTDYANLLKGTGHHCPVDGKSDFNITETHVIYTIKDPNLHYTLHTKQDVFIIDIRGNEKPRELTSGKQGATHCPALSPLNDKAAWLELDGDGYESDRAKIVIYDLKKDIRFTVTQDWDRSPDTLTFSRDGKLLYFIAGDLARSKVFVLPVPPTPSESSTHPQLGDIKPVALTQTGNATGLYPLPNHRVLFSRSTFASPIDVWIIRELCQFEESFISNGAQDFKGSAEQITRLTEDDLKPKGLSQGEEFWFDGAEQKVQGWALKPRGWQPNQKKAYPVVLLIHGGPQGAWKDRWSTGWNQNTFAAQGYFVLAMNPTGSISFGQRFTDAITGDWGGKPFQDMIKGWEAAKQLYPEIDFDRAVAAGASWGGYAINWIQGHPEYGFNFKALVCHDGAFDENYHGFVTDELFFYNHDWTGRPWDQSTKKLTEKFSPSNFVTKWSTPQLILHGSKDYRVPEIEGIGAFHALQQQGIPARLVIFPDENHWVLKHGNSLKWHYEVFRWFDEHLNGQVSQI